jgi:hypothetical protein
LEYDVEPKTVAIKRQCGEDIIHDEERRNAEGLWLSHASFHRGFSRTFATPVV